MRFQDHSRQNFINALSRIGVLYLIDRADIPHGPLPVDLDSLPHGPLDEAQFKEGGQYLPVFTTTDLEEQVCSLAASAHTLTACGCMGAC